MAQASPAKGKAPLPPLELIALGRMGYGPRPGDVEAFRALPGANVGEKLKAYVEQQLNPATIDDSACEARIRGFDTLGKSTERLWREHLRDLPEMNDRYREVWRPTQETRMATVTRAVYSKRQLLEVTVDFWHNHFNTAPDRDERLASLFASYHAHIRKHALGNFQELLVGVAAHPVMLYYLDNASSSRNGPNENWARELFELHTLGAENYFGVKRQKEVPGYDKGQPAGYVDDDVYEATRAFTGWRVADNADEQGLNKNTGEFVFYAPWHDRFQKTILGRQLPPDQPGTKDGMDVLEALAAHPGTARHIARKLARRFIADDPPERVVQEAAKVFQAGLKSPNQIRDTLRVILLSDEFKTTYGEKIKRPLESVYAAMRVLGTEFKLDKRDDILWHLGWAGQFLYGHRPPDGYADYREAWNGTASMLRRWQFGQGLCENWWEFFRSDLVGQTPKELTTPNQLADYWIKRTLGQPMVGPKRDAVVRFLTWAQDPDQPLSAERIKERLPRAVSLVMMMPEFMWR
jgi:uncharacterized protein (DUF1800 family)